MEKVRLGDVCEINPKAPNIPDNTEVSFVPMASVGEHGEFCPLNIKKYIEVKKGFTYFQNEDVLFAKITPCMENGKGAIARDLKNSIGFGSTEFHVLRPKENMVKSKWIYYLTSWSKFREICEKNMTGSAGQKRVTKDFLFKYVIHLPDIATQEKQVIVLDKVSDLINKRKQQLQLLDELVKSKFVEMFGDPVRNSMNWPTQSMESVAPVVNYKGDFGNKVWLLNLDMVEAQTGRIIDYINVNTENVGNSVCTFDAKNVLYSKLRPYLNKVVIPDRIGYATSELIPLRPVESKINREYLAFMLRSDEFVRMISEKVSGAKMPRVQMEYFRRFNVPIPKKELQNQFADFVAKVEKTKSAVNKALAETQVLFDSLMQEYFG